MNVGMDRQIIALVDDRFDHNSPAFKRLKLLLPRMKLIYVKDRTITNSRCGFTFVLESSYEISAFDVPVADGGFYLRSWYFDSTGKTKIIRKAGYNSSAKRCFEIEYKSAFPNTKLSFDIGISLAPGVLATIEYRDGIQANFMQLSRDLWRFIEASVSADRAERTISSGTVFALK